MFRALLSLWGSKDLLSESFELFKKVLEDVEWMFDATTDVLLCKKEISEIEKEIREREQSVDKAEMEIRRKVIEHLSMKGQDVPASLVLFSVVKDAERIGDLCADILTVVRSTSCVCGVSPFSKIIKELEASLESMFSKTRQAFASSDENTAKEAMVMYEKTKTFCNELLNAVLSSSSMTVKESVSYALLSVYFRRVGAHINHIAESVVNPSLIVKHKEEK